jgi:hypothetical protein
MTAIAMRCLFVIAMVFSVWLATEQAIDGGGGLERAA